MPKAKTSELTGAVQRLGRQIADITHPPSVSWAALYEE